MLTLLFLMANLGISDVDAAEPASSSGLPEADKMVTSVGMSEKMGPFGILSESMVFVRGSNETQLFAGTTLFFGGVGAGWRHNFSQGRVVPFTNLSASAIYFLPVMCSSGDCPVEIKPFVIGTGAVDLVVFDGEKRNLHLVLGVMSMFDVVNWELFDSPSDRPAIWPVFNVAISR